MNLTDGIAILILLVSILGSVRRGFIFSSLELLCWAGSLALGFLLYSPVSQFFHQSLTIPALWSAPLSFLMIMAVARVLFEAASKYLLKQTPEDTHHHPVNKILGIIPGAINGLLWIAVLYILLLLTPFSFSFAGKQRQSKLSTWIVDKSRWLGNYISPIFTETFKELVPGNQAAFNKGESVQLPFSVKNATPRPDLEARMLDLVNHERQQHGLKPLQADPEIAVAARKHSADMFARGYFSHITPEGKSPFQRITAEHVFYLTAGENLAYAQTLEIAHQGLMKSPGHRANILRRAFGRLGIGILDGGVYGLMITQNFRD